MYNVIIKQAYIIKLKVEGKYMQVKKIMHPEMKLIGLKVRTSNNNEFNSTTAKIAPLVNRYWAENIAAKIPNRNNPGISIAGYANYESDEYGEYDYLFGEAVTSLDTVPEGLSSLIVPAGNYLHITSNPGKMPFIILETWQKIWDATRNK